MTTQRLAHRAASDETGTDEPAIDHARADHGLCPNCGETAINVQGLLDCSDCGFQG